jgi:hypothetical protein
MLGRGAKPTHSGWVEAIVSKVCSDCFTLDKWFISVSSEFVAAGREQHGLPKTLSFVAVTSSENLIGLTGEPAAVASAGHPHIPH